MDQALVAGWNELFLCFSCYDFEQEANKDSIGQTIFHYAAIPEGEILHSDAISNSIILEFPSPSMTHTDLLVLFQSIVNDKTSIKDSSSHHSSTVPDLLTVAQFAYSKYKGISMKALEQPLISSTEFCSKLTPMSKKERTSTLNISAALLYVTDASALESDDENDSTLTWNMCDLIVCLMQCINKFNQPIATLKSDMKDNFKNISPAVTCFTLSFVLGLFNNFEDKKLKSQYASLLMKW